MELIKKNTIQITGKGILIATKKGTRKYKDGKLVDPGEIVKVIETPNIICNEGLLLVAGFIRDESAVYDVGLVHCEIGTDNTAPLATDTNLGAFHHRNTIADSPRDAYEVTFPTFFTAAESGVAIEEAGIWGGSDSAPDAGGEATGLLFAHWLASFNNSLGLYDITITYVLTVARG